MLWSMGVNPAFSAAHTQQDAAELAISATPLASRSIEPPQSDKTALIFLLERSYLPGLQALLYTLRKSIDRSKFSILLMTVDPYIQEDRFATNVADEIVLFTEKEISRLSSIRSDRVASNLRIPKIGKFTFLKLFCFNDLGYSSHLFMDTDMLVMSDAFDLSSLCVKADYAAAPTVGPRALNVDWPSKNSLKDYDAKQIVTKLKSIASRSYEIHRSFNSGVTFSGRRLLSSTTVDELLMCAASGSFKLEQSITHSYLRHIPDLAFRSLPIWDNFPALPAYVLGQEAFEKLLPEIRILHFNRKKPWEADRKDDTDWLSRIWLTKYAEAQDWIESKSK